MKIWIEKNIDNIITLNIDIFDISLYQKVDVYYFALENKSTDYEENLTDIKRNVLNLINSWIQVINNLNSKCVRFLPFDFSDQYIGCLRIEQIEDNRLIINYGFTTKFQGFSLNPHEINHFIITDNEYNATSESASILKGILLSDLSKSCEIISNYHR